MHAFTLEIGRVGGSLRGVAAGAGRVVSAITVGSTTTIEARTGAQLAWHADLDGRGGPLAIDEASGLVLATVSGTGHVATRPVRGEPSAALVALDVTTGATRWIRPFEASEWSVVSALAIAPDGLLVGGAFSGSLRIGAKVVTSAGKSDGFVAKLTTAGEVAWLVRLGGANADAVQGVAVRGARIAIAGTYASTAELLGTPLPAFDEKTPFTDGFVAELDATGARTWVATFGGKDNESVAGVAIDDAGRVVVAATARDVVHVGGTDLTAQGPGDGLVAWWAADASFLHATLLGGAELDGLSGIAAVGDHVVVGGFYSGTLRLGDRDLTAGGGDDAFLVALDVRATVLEAWPVRGEGREEIVAIAPAPDGFIAGLAHTAAATVDGDPLPAPSDRDPASGAALIVR